METQQNADFAPKLNQRTVDVLIVGSGPVGAAYARVLAEARPHARILMIDRGPRLSDRPGANLKNFLATGVTGDPASNGDDTIAVVDPITLARSGTTLIDPHGPRPGHMPAAAVSTNVGGMGAHWSCATPPPADDERITWVPDPEWDELLARASVLLNSSTSAFGGSVRGRAMIEALQTEFDSRLGRPVQVMPHACARWPDGRLSWTGSDTVLGPLADAPSGADKPFELQADTLCRRVRVVEGRVVGADLEHLPSGRLVRVDAPVVVVAADSLRTPQLLWASGIRPAALGHYLNEHPMVGATVILDDATIDRAGQLVPDQAANDFTGDPLAAVWVPYSGRTHRFSGQIANSAGSPAGFAVAGLEGLAKSRIVSLTWFCPKQVAFEDRIEFGHEVDSDGMPTADITYSLSAQDKAVVAEAVELTRRAGSSFGTFVAGEEPKLLTDGQSLHYMGTVRMGPIDDGTSVCDPYSQVWGVSGLFVGGNGVIPTSTACNPTLTSVALAVRSADWIAKHKFSQE